MTLPRYAAAVLVDRATNLRPVARARERLAARNAAEVAFAGGLPVPPADLRVLVSGPDADWFLDPDAAGVTKLRAVLGEGLRDAVLDFGCGCGRALRHFEHDGLDLHGCDYNPRLVEWCQANLPFADVRLNGAEPPAPYDDDRFDVLYAISILTHLTTPMVRAWLDEWRRIVRPGGLIAFSTHGDHYRGLLGRRDGALYDRRQPVVVKPRIEGLNACSAHHPPEWVRTDLLQGMELVAFEPGAPPFPQDLYVVRA
jgi:SAM-dependent methyltransferase